ncbi:uncharacterized protein [Branchiostoma lanceolatum]|uniref:uncharacterized protein n=1 Tax=Branchiostoma lanceolatum TaxID=7740 RepID=UPI00345140F0
MCQKLREVTGGRNNPNAKARLEFPSSVSIEKRGHLQGLAKQCRLGPQSSGIGNERFLTVYTSENQAKKAKNAQTNAKRLNRQQKVEALNMWRCWKAVGGEGRKFSQKEVEEMMCTGQMDPELRDVYLKWIQAGKPPLNLPTARPGRIPTTQELFDNIEWLKPESGQVGQVFYNKVHLSESGVEDSYWIPEAQGSTQVLSHLEVMPTGGLTHALVCTSVTDYSYILNYFPPSVEVLSVVCPSEVISSALAHKILLKCPQHPADSTSTNPPCDCTDKRLVEIIHPRNSHNKLHANFCVLRYEARVRLVVTSAPFSEQAWTRQGQLGWFCDLPVSSTKVMQQAGRWTADRHPLASDLQYLLYQLGVPQQTVWSVLTSADFTGMSECVRLIPSVPGRVWPRGKDISRVGLVKLAELLSQVPWPAGHDPPMMYQSPHVDCSSSPWLQSLYCSLTGQAKGLFARRDSRKDQLLELLNHIQVKTRNQRSHTS